MNVTVTVPAGSALYAGQLCTPPGWIDILTFYVSNYLIHVGTVPLFPGEKRGDVYIALVAALLFPVIGVARGLDRIARCANFGKTPLEKAARAGALCMVVRDEDWVPAQAPAANSANATGSAHPNLLADISQAKVAAAVISPVDTHETETATIAGSTVEPKEPKLVTVTTSSVDVLKPETTPTAAVNQSASTLRHLTFNYHNGDSTTLQAPWQKDKEVFRWFCWAWIGSEDSVDIQRRRELAAVVQLPPGYSLAFVPQDAVVLPLHELQDEDSPGGSNRRGAQDITEQRSSAFCEDGASPLHRRSVTTTFATLLARLRGMTARLGPARPAGQERASESREIRVAPSSDTFSSISGVAQLVFGLSTLLQTAGPQVHRFGYAAFGLTVLPYVVMSIINTVAALFTPTYTSMYLVHSEIMDEALMQPGAHFEGIVGRIPKGSESLDDFPEPAPDYKLADPYFRGFQFVVPKEIPCELVLAKEKPTVDLRDMPTASRYVWCDQGLSMRMSSNPERVVLHQRWLVGIPSHPPIARKQCLKGRAWPPSTEGRENSEDTPLLWTSVIRLFVSLFCLLPLGMLTRFLPGESSLAERVITMSWQGTGFVGIVGLGIMKAMGSSESMFMFAFIRSTQQSNSPPAAGESTFETGTRPVSEFRTGFTRLSWQMEAIACLLCSAPAIAGLIIVGIMFSSFGTCVQIS